MRTATWEVGEKAYNMKLTTSAVDDLEKRFGRSVLEIFGTTEARIPTVKEIAMILQAAIGYEKPISMSNVMSLIDEYYEEGHNFKDLNLIMANLYIASGLIEDVEGKEEEKN